MTYRYASGALVDLATPLLIVLAKEGTNPKKGLFLSLDDLVGGTLQPALATGDFTGKTGEGIMVYGRGGARIKRMILWGLGKDMISNDTWRLACGQAAVYARNMGIRKFSILIDPTTTDKLGTPELTEGAIVGTGLSLYQFNRHKTVDLEKIKDVEEITLYVEKAKDKKPLEESGARAEILLDGITLARDLQSGPPNVITPTYLARTAEGISQDLKLILHIFDEEALKRMNANGILAVGSGSAEPTFLIVMEYRGGKRGDPPLCIVGKGLCFDSGGLNLKPGDSIRGMKYDMSGSATVLGTLKTAAAMRLPVNVVGVIPAVMNMPDGRAYRPDDIIMMMNGKSVEVDNTDAEGRIVLADALHYAVSTYKPRGVIDLATLTGAIVIALGHHATGLFTNDEDLANKVIAAGERAGEHCWRMPMFDEYRAQIKSDVADMKNTGGRDGGSITAAFFLKEFVGDTPWVHLDIAGTANDVKGKAIYPSGVGTGVGVRLLIELMKTWE
ncbi:MAG: leucyl aminopeptidase [bacterium]|nr:leucyl aminopeptidase [bacterium]